MKSKRCMVSLIAVAMMAATVPSGAQQAPAKSPATARAAGVPIAGEVFVVTKGQQSIRLPLVNVAAISEKQLIEQVDRVGAAVSERQKDFQPNVEAAKAAWLTAKQESEAAKVAWESGMVERRKAFMAQPTAAAATANNKANSEALDEHFRLQKIENAKQREYRAAKIVFDRLGSPETYFEQLPSPVAVSKTDPDGRFKLSVPKGRYVIAAKSSRTVGDATEHYYWLVRIEASGGPASLMLSNDNLVETSCADCVRLPGR
jgi:hypothetical protein